MANQFGPHFDQLERQRRIARQIIPADPLAAHRLTLEKAMFVDPIPHLQEFLAKITGADRIAEIRRALVPAPPDLFGPQRRAIEQLTRRHTDAYDQVIGRLGGRTVNDAIDAGEDPKTVWRAVCEHFEIPVAQRH